MNDLKEKMLNSIKSYLFKVMILFSICHLVLIFILMRNLPLWSTVYQIVSSLFYGFASTVIWKTSEEKATKVLPVILSITIVELLANSLICAILTNMSCCFQNYLYIAIIFIMLERYLSHSKRTYFLCGLVLVGYLGVNVIISRFGNYNLIDPGMIRFFSIANLTGTLLIMMHFVVFLANIIIHVEGVLQLRATHDKLTGLPNRVSLKDIPFLPDSTRVAMLDIDNFKKINDTNGHDVGDEVLKKLAEVLNWYAFHKEISIMRWGGEEFVIIFSNPGRTDDEIKDILLSMLKTIRLESLRINSKEISYTVTMGVANYTEGKDLEELIILADDRLYQGKKSGKNRIVFYNNEVLL